MGLMKPSSGLPKFSAVCGFWRHPAWIGADLDELGLWLAGISYCYEHGTDGHLPPRSSLASGLGLPEKVVKRALEKLLARGRFEDCVTFIEIVGFLDHNPSAQEVRESKERRSKAGRKGAESRWSSESDANANANRNGDRNSTELSSKEPDVAASASSGSRQPLRPVPPLVSTCGLCGLLQPYDCTCETAEVRA